MKIMNRKSIAAWPLVLLCAGLSNSALALTSTLCHKTESHVSRISCVTPSITTTSSKNITVSGSIKIPRNFHLDSNSHFGLKKRHPAGYWVEVAERRWFYYADETVDASMLVRNSPAGTYAAEFHISTYGRRPPSLILRGSLLVN